MYALNLAPDGRILSATYPQYAPAGALMVSVLPEGDITEYCYVDGRFIHSPLPSSDPQEPELTPQERITALEEENAMLLECILEISEIVYA